MSNQGVRASGRNNRKYAPGPPLGGPKDDLHEWSIYRQNLTSTLADSLLSGLAQSQHKIEAIGGSARSSTRGHARHFATAGPTNLPYGDFQMHDQAVESVLNRGRRQDPYLGDKGQVYLRFGLPRVALTNEKGIYALARPGGLDYKNRKSQSEMDVRRAVLEAPAIRGPYYVKSYNSTDLINLIGARPLQQQSYEYAQSEIGLAKLGDWRLEPMALNRNHGIGGSQRSLRSHHLAPLSVALPGLAIDDPPSSTSGAPLVPQGPSSAPYLSNGQNGLHQSPLPPGSFLQGKRHHHGHYFSNLDLFTASTAYNYLRYAKADELQTSVTKQPHLQLRHFGFDIDRRSRFDIAMLRAPKYRRILDDVSLEVFGGETLAIMYTSKEELAVLFSLLANQHGLKGRLDGSVLVNGLPMSGKLLGDRIAYVCTHDLHPMLTVREHLRLQCAFIKPASEAFPTMSMVANLIQTLALAPYHNRMVGELGRTEKIRLRIACQILLDADILLLDDVFHDMDLYDTAFLIDYLRDWASKLNRIVITATKPSTLEILSMYNKSAILASGRLVYFGATQRMLNYFESLNYPCPLFKNPCDYYVDLVTHDYLTVEVAMESSERIRRLAEAWHQRAPKLSEPGPGGLAPPRYRHVNPFSAMIWIYYRFWLLFLNRPWEYVRECFYSLLMSAILGSVFYQLTVTKQAGINDRLGLFYALLTLFHLPNLLLQIERIGSERLFTFYDNIHNVYPRISYVFAKLCFDFPHAFITYSTYAIPVYFMAQLQPIYSDHGKAFGVYVGLTILYCYSTRMLAWASGYIFGTKIQGALFMGIFLTFFSLTAGVTLHPNDRWFIIGDWARYGSPTQWMQQIFIEHEFTGNATALISIARQNLRRSTTMLEFGCDAKEIKFGPIVTTAPCPIVNGFEALKFTNLTLRGISSAQNATYYVGPPVTAGIAMLCICIVFLATSILNYHPKRKMKHRDI